MTMCDRIAVLDQGVIQQIGTPVELFDRPVNRFVAQFVGSVNLFEGAIRRGAEGLVFESKDLGPCHLPEGLEAVESARVELALEVSIGGAGANPKFVPESGRISNRKVHSGNTHGITSRPLRR